MSEVEKLRAEVELPGHTEWNYDLGTPRQYTARGGWNVVCECGVAFAETGDEDHHERWLKHLAGVTEAPRG